MPSDARLRLHFRLEDVVALSFFLINLGMQIFFRGLGRQNLSPANILIIIPAVTLLLAKELVTYFVSGRERPHAPARTQKAPFSGEQWHWESGGDFREFVRPYW
jgi:hypothetical protein